MTPEDDPGYPLGRGLEVLERLWRVNHAMQRVSNRMSRDLGLTGPQRLVVRCVGKYPGVTAGKLAAMLHLDPGTVSVALNRLEHEGLLERRTDPSDRRRVALGLTARGRDLDHPAEHTIEAAVEHLLDKVTRDELEASRRVLGTLAELLEHEADREA